MLKSCSKLRKECCFWLQVEMNFGKGVRFLEDFARWNVLELQQFCYIHRYSWVGVSFWENLEQIYLFVVYVFQPINWKMFYIFVQKFLHAIHGFGFDEDVVL